MTSELGLKIAEVFDYVLENNLESYVWRGTLPLSNEEWKIMVTKSINNYIYLQVKQRADGNGDPV